jgi:ADP-ribose diphosphatase
MLQWGLISRAAIMKEKPRIISSRTVASSRLFEVEQLDLEFSNGVTAEYERLCSRSHGAVLVVPMLDADTVLLIREYAAGVHRYELALPKGRIEADEDRHAAANRELMEEIGYGARRLRTLSRVSLAPGYLSHVTDIILAEDLYPQRLPGDEPEPLDVVPWSLARLDELLQRDDCTEARSIAALYMARDLLATRN